MESRRAVVDETHAGARIDLACCDLFPELSRKRIKAIIDQGGAYRNRKRVSRANETVHLGDVVEIHWREGAIRSRPTLAPHDVVAVDEDFLIIRKPAGLPTQATLESTEGTVLEALEKDLLDSHADLKGPFYLVHRLDKDTSGLLIVARNLESKQAFDEQFKKQMVQKSYLALVAGKPTVTKGVIDCPIAKDSLGPNRYRIVRADAAGQSSQRRGKGSPSMNAKSARTDYELLAFNESSSSSLIVFRPRTGRTHQIRVHSAQMLGCPLLGDKTYATQLIGHPVHFRALRHMLHAWKLKFPHPRHGEWVTYEASLPKDFQECLGECGLILDGSDKA